MAALEGKGCYIWKLHMCDGGNAALIARRAQQAGLSHVLIKIADGPRAYNVDLAALVVEALKEVGIQIWGWQFVYGDEPFGEAEIAAHRIKTLRLDGFVLNAEVDYKKKHLAAAAYMDHLRSKIGALPVGLGSFRYPHIHPEMPWAEFLSRCDFNMPQVYWIKANDPAAQIDKSISQFKTIYPVRPIIPTGAAYEELGWRPQPIEITQFFAHARKLGLSAANVWSWDYAGSPAGQDFWQAISQFEWPTTTPALDITELLSNALNQRDVDAILALYQPNTILSTPDFMISGHDNLRNYYINLLATELPGATFRLDIRVVDVMIRTFKWEADGAANGRCVGDGFDTLTLHNGLIQHHSSVYHVV